MVFKNHDYQDKDPEKGQTMPKNVVETIDDQVKINTLLVSVSDKTGLETLIPGMIAVNPDLVVLSTGGTFGRLKEILGPGAGRHLQQVSDYTGQPETQGGLVKTLDFKIYLGLLTETYNDAHQADLARTGARPIDMVVVNLYPFARTIARTGVTLENARGNIDIGGPAMIRAAAKNFIRVASVTNPADYPDLLGKLKAGQGYLTLADRFDLAARAFEHTADYDRAIAGYLAGTTGTTLLSCYHTGA
jgi:phosphoribosylaminoimidazolecarboxamide formyltransferase / IMP cyclohydrolase